MKKTSMRKLYDWKVMCSKKDRLTTLRRYSTGAEQAAYRAMLEECIKEMEALTPEIVEIFRRIKRQSVINDIVAIYFGGSSYQEWSEIQGVPLDTVFRRVTNALDEIDHEIEDEANNTDF